MGLTRRTILAAGAAAAATAAVPRVSAQNRAKEELASSTSVALFASTTRRLVPASRCYCFRAAD